VHAVCRFFLDEKVQDKQLHALNNEDFIAYITQIKGVGRWTAEMLLMFAMGREDVFAVDDLGIQQAMIRLYGLDAADKKQLKADMLRISEKWKPYRTYACLYLWGWKDNTPAAVKKKSAQ
jgi:DNA-3-methyladenine glycosylase II